MKTHVIGEKTRIEGELSADGNLRIAGSVTGRIRVEESVVIESSARVSGEISAAAVIVRGAFEGRIAASGRITLEPGSRTQAELECTRIGIAEGAVFRGTIYTAEESATMRVAPVQPPAAPAAQPAPTSGPASAATDSETTVRVAAPDAETVRVAPPAEIAAQEAVRRRHTHDVPTVLRTNTSDHAAVSDDDGPENFVMPGAVEVDDDRGEPTTETTTDKSPAQVALLDDDAMQPGPRRGRRR